MMALLCLVLCVGQVVAGSPWTRGSYGKLTFTADCKSYKWEYGPNLFPSKPLSLANVTDCASSSGKDSLGSFDELALTFDVNGVLAVRYYEEPDAFIFQRRPKTQGLALEWPAFDIDNFPEGADNLTIRCLGWGEHYFFPGGVLPRTAHTNPQPFTLHQCNSGGPLFIFGVAAGTGHAFAMSPLDNFTTQGVNRFSITVGKGGCRDKCNLYPTSSLLMARPGLTRITRAFGAFLRRRHNTYRLRGPGVTQLSYWNDNQAGYSWWTVGPDQEVWGKPEDIYLKLKAEYDKAGVPIRGWEPDNNWLVTYGDGNLWGNGSGTKKNWNGRQWDYNTELYPSGGEEFVSRLGNLSMVYYTNGFNNDNAYKDLYHMTKNNEPHPNVSFKMYSDLIGHAKSKYGMEMLFTDFLCYRQPEMEQYQDVDEGEEGGHLWLGGQALAAQSHGVEVQWCMALAHQILESTQFPSVTNARVNGDGGLDVGGLVFPALLAATVGLGWSKDNLRTADRCYVPGLFPNGSVKWPCGSINQREGTSGQFKMQTQQTILATLSLGPVGISDQLSSYPTNASATITSNVPLVMSTCAATGDLLQPSYPLTPLERSIAGQTGNGIQLWGTYTAINTPTKDDVGVWFTALAFRLGKTKLDTTTVMESDLAPMIDTTSLPSPSFGDVPLGRFHGAGTQFPSGPSGWVSWNGDFSSQRSSGCQSVNVSAWSGMANVSLTLSDGDGILNIAPIMGSPPIALLGEAGKITAVSTYRFASVSPSTDGNKIVMNLRGKPGEQVNIMFAVGSSSRGEFRCHSKMVVIGSDGTKMDTLP